MDLRQLTYFEKIAATGSFTAAAERLHVSQPALGMQIRKLENEFSTQLFFRHSRGVTLTDAGRVLLGHATDILERFDDARQALRDQSGPPTGGVSLGVTPTVGRVIVPQLLERSRSHLPGVAITLFEGLSEEVMAGVAAGRFDLGFSYNPNAARGVQCTPLLSENLYLIGAQGARKPRTKTVPFAEIPNYPLILPSRPHGIRLLLEKRAAAAGLKLDVTLEIDSIYLERELIERGLGYTVLPFGGVSQEVNRGSLFAKEITDPILARTLYLVASRQRPVSRAVEATARLIEATMEENVRSARWHWRPTDGAA